MVKFSKRTLLKVTTAAAVLGPRTLLAQSPRLMEGPMVGHVTSTSIVIWVRTSWPIPVSVEYDSSPNFTAPKRTQAVTPQDLNDMTAQIVVADLKPATTYYYRILIDGRLERYQDDLPLFPVKTAPPDNWRGKFTVAMGSCARVMQDPIQPVWRAIQDASPDLFFWLGDNIYADTLHADVFAEEYRRQRAVPASQPVLRSVPQLAVWDDHDFGVNDGDRRNPEKHTALEQFKRYWANPSYGTNDTPGVFFKYTYGGVDFFFMDCRMYRDPNEDEDSPTKTMLGAGQLAWIKKELIASTAPFKMLITGSGWSAAKGHGGDSWASHITERNGLFDFIRDNKIGGVVLLSGDTHVAELNCIPWSEKGGYDFYDLTTSPLAQRPEVSFLDRSPEVRIRQVFNRDSNFGLITFDTSGDTDPVPVLSYNVYDTHGRAAWTPMRLKASDLQNGVSSWREKIDALSLERQERWTAGGPYYPVR